jgi:hypothetical protein
MYHKSGQKHRVLPNETGFIKVRDTGATFKSLLDARLFELFGA